MLFDGCIRIMIMSGMIIDKYSIPLDLIELCWKFLNIKFDEETLMEYRPSTDIYGYDPIRDLYKFAIHCYRKYESWIAIELLRGLSAFDPTESRYHNAMGLAMDDWNCSDEAENSFKIHKCAKL